MKLTLGQWLEKHCVQSALPLLLGCTVQVLSLKFCQWLQGLIGVSSEGGRGDNQLCVPVVLTLLLLCKSAYLHANTTVSEEA